MQQLVFPAHVSAVVNLCSDALQKEAQSVALFHAVDEQQHSALH